MINIKYFTVTVNFLCLLVNANIFLFFFLTSVLGILLYRVINIINWDLNNI